MAALDAGVRAEAIAAARRRRASAAGAEADWSVAAAKRRLTGDRPLDAALWRPQNLARRLAIDVDAGGCTLRFDGRRRRFADACARRDCRAEPFAAGGDDLPSEPAVLVGLDAAWPSLDVAALVALVGPGAALAVDGGPSLARASFAEARVSARAHGRPASKSGRGGFPDDARFSRYAAYCASGGGGDDAPLYVFDHVRVPDLGPVPACFADDASRDLVAADRRPLPEAWLLVGAARSGTPMHDHPLTAAWNALLGGAKLWVALPPDAAADALAPTGTFDLSAAEWFLAFLDRALPAGAVPIVQRPGEAIFVPAGWWHVVLNAADAVAVSRSLALRRDFRFLDRDAAEWTALERDRAGALAAARRKKRAAGGPSGDGGS